MTVVIINIGAYIIKPFKRNESIPSYHIEFMAKYLVYPMSPGCLSLGVSSTTLAFCHDVIIFL